MKAQIQGTTMPVLEVQLDPNESVFSESGELSWMTASIQMMTHTQMGGGGGIFGVLKRAAAGASIFMTEYRAVQYPGAVSFATKVPGHIVPVELGQGFEYLVHRHGFLCATPQVNITLGFQQSLGAGIFGGDGFLLQKLSGVGTAWLELSGELVQKTLAPGEVLRVHPGHVGAFQSSVGFQITMVPGIRNMIFGGDGLFLAQMVGPGTVWLQTLPISRLAHQIYEYIPHNEGRAATPAAVGGGLLGGIVGSILSGDQ
ncbi:MAG: TIGR00266 family protein [Terracidiphilus sp.]